MIDQDFTKKMTVVLDSRLESWKLLNTVGHIVAFLGNKMDTKFATGDLFETKDGISYPRNSQYPLIALSATQQQLRDLMKKIRETSLLFVAYIPEMIEYTDDKRLMAKVSQKTDDEIEYLGIGLFGDNDKLKELTKEYKLWK